MGHTFSVDPDELFDLSQNAALLATSIGEQQLAGVVGTLAGVSGQHQVEEAHTNFVHQWSNGLDKISHNLTEFSNRVGEAAAMYSSTEHQIVTAEGGDYLKRDRSPSPHSASRRGGS